MHLLMYGAAVRCHTRHVFHEQSWTLSDFLGGWTFFFSSVNGSYCVLVSPCVNLGSNVFDKQRGAL